MLDVHCFLHRLNNFLFLADGWCLHGSKASSQYVWLSVMTIGHFCYPEEHKKFVELWDWLYPVTCESGHHPVWWLFDFVKLIHHCFEWNLIFKHVYWCKSWVFFVKSLDPTSSLTVDILNENYCELGLVTLKIKQWQTSSAMLSGPQSVQEWAACNPNLLTSTRTTSSPHATTLHQLSVVTKQLPQRVHKN
jgi:hypothetical protein